MNKLRTANLLMGTTILLIIAYQVYWVKKLYEEEQSNFKRSADVIFRDAMYRLQFERFKGDSIVLKGMHGENLFMMDVANVISKTSKPGDTAITKMTLTVSTTHNGDPLFTADSARRVSHDTMLVINNKNNKLPPEHIEQLLLKNKTINDSIPLKSIDSMYRALLNKEGIHVGFHIVKTAMPISPDSTKRVRVRLNPNGTGSKIFQTNKVPVGIASPLLYNAEFDDNSFYILKKISLQLLLSLLLVALTLLSFIFIYRNLLAQKRLTAIKNEFIGNITHELKTPISTVSVAIEAMRNFNALENPERTKEYLGIAGQELNRLSLLVDKVLRLSMFETQQVQLKYEWFDLHELLNEVMNSMQLQFEKFHAAVDISVTGSDFNIMADRMHITSVIYNLLDNALKYSKENPEVNIILREEGKQLVFEVADKGIGIPDSYKEKIFDKFFRVPNGDRHNVKGYGLGLSYTAHIIAEHKGSIQVESSEGKGTRFIIKLPKENEGS